MSRDNRRTKNGFTLKIGDKVRLVGPKERDNIVYFANEMEKYLGSDDVYTVDHVDIHSDGTIIQAGGWSWDIKYTKKVLPEVDPASIKPQTKETSLFDVDTLVIT